MVERNSGEEEEERNKKINADTASKRKHDEKQLQEDIALLFPAAREGGAGSVEDGVFMLGAVMEKEKGRKVSREEIAKEAKVRAREVRLKSDIETLIPATRDGGALSHQDGEFVYAAIIGGDAGNTDKVSRENLAKYVHERAQEVRTRNSPNMETAMRHVSETRLASNIKVLDTAEQVSAQLSLPKTKAGPKIPGLS